MRCRRMCPRPCAHDASRKQICDKFRTMNCFDRITVAIAALVSIADAAAAQVPSAQASAAIYPDRPVRLIVPSPPGGGNDIMARLGAQRLAEAWGKQFVIDNRPG